MRKILFAVLLALCGATFARAQATIAVSAAHIQGLNGAPLASGSLCFQATDQNDINIGIQVSGGGTVVATPFCTSVTNGAITTFNVPNPSTASPLNTRYRIYVTQGSRLVARFPLSYLCNQSGACTTPWTFNFDSCLSSGACIANPVPIVNGPAGPTGPPGLPCNFRGTYNAGTTYAQTDCVISAGSYYISLVNSNTGNTPSSNPTDWGTLTGSALPGTPVNCLQYNLASAFSGANGLCTPDSNVLTVKGPNPHADVTAWGARGFNGSIPQGLWAACFTNTTVTLTTSDGGFTFINGDGIEIDFCGPTPSMSTPSAPTVTPATAAGPTGTGVYAPIPAGVAGSSTYSYKVIAKDKFGGLTAPSSATTITNGQATLGLMTATISTITRSNDTLTVTTSGNVLTNQTISANSNSMVRITAGTAQNQMSGFYGVCVQTSPTVFTLCATPIDTRAQGWTSADTYNQSAGSVDYFVSNHIKITAVTGAWEYYICAERPGDSNYHLIGVTRPQGVSNGYQDLDFDDYGSPFMNKQTYPRYMLASGDTQDANNAICTAGSATPEMYSGVVTAGGGTTTLTVTPATSQTNSGPVFTTVDAEPGFLAAAKQSNFSTSTNGMFGPVLIPGGSTPNAGVGYGGRPLSLYYPLFVPTTTNIQEEGFVVAYEAIHLQGSSTWSGILSSECGTPQFGWNSYSCVYGGTNEPIFYVSGQGNMLDHLGLNTNQANGGIGAITDNANGFWANSVNFYNGVPSTDYLSMGLIMRDTTATITYVNLNNTLFLGGPAQVTDASWTPLIWFPPGENGSGVCQLEEILLDSYRMSLNRRGIASTNNQCSGGPYFLNMNYVYRQGGIMPMFTFQSQSPNFRARIFNTNQDTEGNPLIACINGSQPCGSYDLSLNALTFNNSLYSGVRPTSLRIFDMASSGTGDLFGVGNKNGCIQNNASSLWPPFDTAGSYLVANLDLFTCFTPMHIPSGQSFYFDIAQPTSVSATAAAGGSVPAGTYYYCVSPVGYDLGEGICSGQSNSVTTVLSGNQTVNLTWTGSLGAQSYNIYRCSAGAACLNDGVVHPSGGWARVALHQTGISYSDTNASTTATTPPSVSGTGVTTANKKLVNSPTFLADPQAFAALASCTSAIEGTVATVTDSTTTTWGNTVTGGGSNVVLAFCDGSNWTVYGK